MARFDFARILRQMGPELANMGPELAPILESLARGGSQGQGSQGSGGIDSLQNVLDLLGVADPTPTVDTVNAVISLYRASKSTNPAERKRHLLNAGISAISGFVPYLGDTAKLAKFRRGAGGAAGGGPPLPPPPPGSSSSVASPLSGALPFLAGAGAGAAFGAFGGFGGGMSDVTPRKYHTRDLFLNSAHKEMGSDLMRMGGRVGSAAWDIASGPLNLISWVSATRQLLTSVMEMPGAVKHWGEALVDSQQHLKSFSGVMAQAFQEGEIRQLVRNIGSAQRTSGTTLDLQRAIDSLKDETQTSRDAITNLSNQLATAGIKTVEYVFNYLRNDTSIGRLIGAIKDFTDSLPKKPGAGGDVKTPVFELLDNIRRLPPGGTRRPRPN